MPRLAFVLLTAFSLWSSPVASAVPSDSALDFRRQLIPWFSGTYDEDCIDKRARQKPSPIQISATGMLTYGGRAVNIFDANVDIILERVMHGAVQKEASYLASRGDDFNFSLNTGTTSNVRLDTGGKEIRCSLAPARQPHQVLYEHVRAYLETGPADVDCIVHPRAVFRSFTWQVENGIAKLADRTVRLTGPVRQEVIEIPGGLNNLTYKVTTTGGTEVSVTVLPSGRAQTMSIQDKSGSFFCQIPPPRRPG